MTDNIGIARVTPLPSLYVDPPHWSLPEPADGLALRWDKAAGAWVDVAARGEVCEDCGEPATKQTRDGVWLCDGDYEQLQRQWAQVPEDWK